MNWFRGGRMGQRKKPVSSVTQFHPCVEAMEERLAPAVVEWDGGPFGTGTNWCDAVNWQGDRLPTADDEVRIGDDFAGRTITAACDIAIRNVRTETNLEVVSATFSLVGQNETSDLAEFLLIGPNGVVNLFGHPISGVGARIDNHGTLAMLPSVYGGSRLEIDVNNHGLLISNDRQNVISRTLINSEGATIRISGELGLRVAFVNLGLVEVSSGSLSSTALIANQGYMIYRGTGGGLLGLIRNDGHIIVEGGGLCFGSSRDNPVVNNGVLRAQGGNICFMDNAFFLTSLTNNGYLMIDSERLVEIQGGGSLTNLSSNTLSGGVYDIAGEFRFPGADIRTNVAEVILDGSGALLRDSQQQPGLRNFTTNTTNGIFQIRNGFEFRTASFTNAGSVTVEGNTGFIVRDDYTQTAGGSTCLAGGRLGTSTTGSVVIAEDSYLGGWGELRGNVVNHGTVDVGGTGFAGMLTIRGNYTQSGTGNLVIDLGGTSPGFDHDFLDIRLEKGFDGTATLDGTLTIRLLDGYLPVPDDFFVPFCAEGGITDGTDFAWFDGLQLSDELALYPFHDGTCYYLWAYAF